MRRRSLPVWWLRHRSRRFVILKYSRDFTEKPLLFLRILRLILATARLNGRRRRLLSSEQPREESFTLIAGLARLRSGNERRNVIVRAGRGRQAVRGLVELHIHYAGRLREFPHFGVLRQLGRLLHELSPDGRRRHPPGQFQIVVVVIPDPNNAQQI